MFLLRRQNNTSTLEHDEPHRSFLRLPSRSFHTPVYLHLQSFHHFSKRRRTEAQQHTEPLNAESCRVGTVREQCGSCSHMQREALRNVPAHTVQAICCVRTLKNFHSCTRTINKQQQRQTCSGENMSVEGKKKVPLNSKNNGMHSEKALKGFANEVRLVLFFLYSIKRTNSQDIFVKSSGFFLQLTEGYMSNF